MNTLSQLKAFLWRQIFFKLVVFTPKFKLKHKDTGVVMLLQHSDVAMALISLQSLFFFLGYALPVFIVDDGSLSQRDRTRLRSLFSVKILTREEAHSQILQRTEKYLYLKSYFQNKNTHVKKMKLAAAILAPFNKIILLEPDHLFYKYPAEVNAFTKTGKTTYAIMRPCSYARLVTNIKFIELPLRKLLYKHLNLDSPERFNGGLMMFKSSFFSHALTKMDEIYKTLEEIDYDKMFYIEETLLATTISKSRDKALDASKYVQLVFDNELTTPMLKEAVVVHFTDKRKRLFNMQALQLLFSKSFLKTPQSMND